MAMPRPRSDWRRGPEEGPRAGQGPQASRDVLHITAKAESRV
jgi:hypothetical protein